MGQPLGTPKNHFMYTKKGLNFVGARWWPGAGCEHPKNIWCAEGLTPLTGCKSLSIWCTRLMHTNYLG
jgi:hypothetical protein